MTLNEVTLDMADNIHWSLLCNTCVIYGLGSAG